MKLYYYHDKSAHTALNSEGKYYTAAYIPIMLKNSGFTACELTCDMLKEGVLCSNDVLIIGADTLCDQCVASLKAATDSGTTVIAFAATAKGLFPELRAVFSAGRYKNAGYFYLNSTSEPLPVLGTVNAVQGQFESLATIKAKDEKEYAGLIKVSDNVYLFTFDLPASLCDAADGPPTVKPDFLFPFPYGRVPDGYTVDCDYDYEHIAYADSYMRIISDIITSKNIPYIYPLPQNDGKVSDITLYFAGDDDATSKENNMAASDAMFERGLPYHINLMPCNLDGDFVIDRNDFELLHERGCETALHYDFLTFPNTPEGFMTQADMYERAFGERSRGPVQHCLIQHSSAQDRYRMQIAAGDKGDNNRFQATLDLVDINAFNQKGFAFGSAFPRFVMDDAEHANIPLEFVEVYNSYYEPRIYNDEEWEYKKISDYLDDGFRYGRPMQLFTHPHYIGNVVTDATPALKALDYAIQYVKEKGWNVYLSGPDALMYWWYDRAKCSIEDITISGFTVNNPTDRVIDIVLPDGVCDVKVNDAQTVTTKKTLADKDVYIVSIAPGVSKISY